MMAGFDLHSVCARCCDKKKGKDPCVEKPDSECQHCKVLTPEQLAQLSTTSYKLKKEKRDKSDTTPSKNPSSSVTLSPTLVDPARVSVIRAVDGQDTGLSAQPAEKRRRWKKRRSWSSPSPHLQLVDRLQFLPTRDLKKWTRNGRTSSTG